MSRMSLSLVFELGSMLILRSIFNPVHPPGTIENNLSPSNLKGRVDPQIAAKGAAAQDAERARVQAVRDSLPPVETILGLDEFQVSFLS